MDDVENGVVVKEDLEEQKPSVQEETTAPENSRDLNTPNGDLPQRKELSNSDCSRYKPCLAVRIIAPPYRRCLRTVSSPTLLCGVRNYDEMLYDRCTCGHQPASFSTVQLRRESFPFLRCLVP